LARAPRLGQGDIVNPAVPTGQTPEQMASEIPAHNSNEELRRAAEKRSAADADQATNRGTGADQRGFTER
jgi:hypothetical protein